MAYQNSPYGNNRNWINSEKIWTFFFRRFRRGFGEPQADGTYPAETINFLVDRKLKELAEGIKEFGGCAKEIWTKSNKNNQAIKLKMKLRWKFFVILFVFSLIPLLIVTVISQRGTRRLGRVISADLRQNLTSLTSEALLQAAENSSKTLLQTMNTPGVQFDGSCPRS